MKNSDFIKAKAEFECAADVGGGVSYILLADNQDAESGNSVVSDSCTGNIEAYRHLLMLLINRHPELKSCFASSFIREASHAPVRFGGDGGIRVAQSPISRWQRTLPFNFKRYLCNKEQQE